MNKPSKFVSMNSPKKLTAEQEAALKLAEEWLKNNQPEILPMGKTAKNYADAKSWTDETAIPFVITKNKEANFQNEDVEPEEDNEGNPI